MTIIGIDARPLFNEPAGIGQYVRELVDYVPSDEIKLLLFITGKGKNDSLQDNCCSLRYQDDNLSRKNIEIISLNWPGILWHLQVALAICRSKEIKYYHSTYSLITPILIGKKCILTITDLSPINYSHAQRFWVRFIYMICLRIAVIRCKSILVFSEFIKNELIAIYPNSASKCTVVPLTVPTIINKGRRESTSPSIICLATQEPRKNLQTVLKAWRILINSGYDGQLELIGRFGWKSNLKADIANMNLSKSVNILGYVSEEEKITKLLSAWVMVYPSFYEGFGLPVLEAMQVGLPVITSKNTAMSEITKDNAYLIDPSSVEDVAKAIKILVSHPVKRARVSARLKATYQLFTPEIFRDKMHKVYEQN